MIQIVETTQIALSHIFILSFYHTHTLTSSFYFISLDAHLQEEVVVV
jgi:hypothetical protein